MNKLIMIITMFFKRIIYKFRNKSRISLLAFFDNKSLFGKSIYIDRFCILHDVSIGDYSYIAYSSSIASCKIGKFCSIASNVKIGLPSHPLDMTSTSPVFYNRVNRLGIKWVKNDLISNDIAHTIIGNDVWIGANAIIMSGVKVGDGSVIGAGAIVTKDVEPYSVVVGIPAKVIKKRFDDDTIINLLKIKWWNWDESKIKKNIEYFVEPKTLIDMINKETT